MCVVAAAYDGHELPIHTDYYNTGADVNPNFARAECSVETGR
jgi:hypothetical protein